MNNLKLIKYLPTFIIKLFEKLIKFIPYINNEIEDQTKLLTDDLYLSMKPYKSKFNTYAKLPNKGKEYNEVLNDVKNISSIEESRWKNGYVSGGIYHGGTEHIDFINKVYSIQSQSNPLHSDLFPSASKFESEIISMTSNILNSNNEIKSICGTVTSGGTESILLAMKTYRDKCRKINKIKKPNIVIPKSAHAAFQKAGEYFNIEIKYIPIDKNYKADLKSLYKIVNRNTICIVGSAPNFPQGTIDPIEKMSEFALKKNINFHVDACLGGFILPFAKKLGYPIEKFDFSLPGVTSISVDTHKYGYTSKGTSIILYKNSKIREFQYYTNTEWSGGLYFSPTFAGSRPGALSAAAWASMISIGEQGYIESTKKILEVAKIIKNEINKMEEIEIMGDPLWVIAFKSKKLDIYKIMDQMTKKEWNLNGLHKPACIHLCVTLLHTKKGVVERFINDLKESISFVKNNPTKSDGMAPVYGLAASLPFRGVVRNLLIKYLNNYYKV